MKPTLLVLLIGFLFSSCATLLNTNIQALTIALSEPARIVLDGDTLPRLAISHYRVTERSRDSLKILAINDHTSKTIKVKAHNSPAYWMNFYASPFMLGFLVDLNSPKRYSYPPMIYIDMNKKGNDYFTIIPPDPAYLKFNNIVKINPLKAVSPINSGLEISLEKRMSAGFATQLSGTYLFQNSLWRDQMDPQIKGFQAGIEERYYLKRSAPFGPYLAMDFSYLKSQSKESWLFMDGEAIMDSTIEFRSYRDTFGIRKQTYSLSLKYGYQYVKKRWTIDLYVGMGFRYKEIVHVDRLKPEDVPSSFHEPNFYQMSNKSGNRWAFILPFNVRLGWTF